MISIRYTPIWAAFATLAVGAPGPAVAGPYTDVASAFDAGDAFDLHVTLDYAFEAARATVQREAAAAADTDPIPHVDELSFAGTRHVLTPRLELGVVPNVALTVALPVILTDTRSLDLATNRDASTTLGQILPVDGVGAGGGPLGTGGDAVFRGPTRAGLDQLHLGLIWAPMNQRKDDTKPTWKLGGELLYAVGPAAAYDRDDPGSATGVGSGVDEVRVWTSVARRMGWAEPYVAVWWQAPIRERDDSPFADLGFGQLRSAKQQTAGTLFGLEAIAWERPARRQRVSLELSGRLEALFEGRAYTPMWEAFAFAGAAGSGGPLVLDADPTAPDIQTLSHPGVSNVENYLRYGGRVGLRAELGDTVRLGMSVDVAASQDHVITFADAGVDRPTCEAGQAPGAACEVDDNAVVDANSEEVNPAHVGIIDVIGGRYFLAGAVDYAVTVDARFLF